MWLSRKLSAWCNNVIINEFGFVWNEVRDIADDDSNKTNIRCLDYQKIIEKEFLNLGNYDESTTFNFICNWAFRCFLYD